MEMFNNNILIMASCFQSLNFPFLKRHSNYFALVKGHFCEDDFNSVLKLCKGHHSKRTGQLLVLWVALRPVC